MNETQRKHFAHYVKGLRDTADRDYLVARICNRLGLYQPSAWSALQAMEKYLKAILLYSHQATEKYKDHDLSKLLGAVKQLPKIRFSLPAECEAFTSYLTAQGANRYFDVPVRVEGLELFKLDRLVWHVRRYCQDFLLLPGDAARYPGESRKRLAAIPRRERSWATGRVFSLPGGFLEGVLDKSAHELRPSLVWRNLYYGSRRKRTIRRYTQVMHFSRPVHVMRPEILLPLLKPLVFFPKDLWAKLEKHRAHLSAGRA